MASYNQQLNNYFIERGESEVTLVPVRGASLQPVEDCIHEQREARDALHW